jgi:hypothetical protein
MTIRYGDMVVKHVPGVLTVRECWFVDRVFSAGLWNCGTFPTEPEARRIAAALSLLSDEQWERATKMALGEA